MEIKPESTITEVCNYLESIAEKQDDIFVLSFRADRIISAYRILNKGKGFDAEKINNFSKLKNVIFTDTAEKRRTDLVAYMKKYNFNEKKGDGELVIAYDGRTKTPMMIAVHNSNLGPAAGGLREKNYSTFDSMVTDTLRLARAMTYKAAVADTNTGGGKATRFVPKGIRKDANLAMARLVNFIAKKREERDVKPYITAEDSNTHCEDFDDMDSITPYAICRSLHLGGSGNPSPVTAIGVYEAMSVGAEYIFPDKSLKNKTVLLSGVGQCGFELAKNLVYNGVGKLICAEINEERIKWVKNQFERMEKTDKLEFIVYTKEQLQNQQYLIDLANKIDIFAPCALGKSISDTNISVLRGTRLKLICGSENNQLADEEKHSKMLHEMGILYIPDFVANAGGIINCVTEIKGRAFLICQTIDKSRQIGKTVREIIEMSKKENITTLEAAKRIAENKFMK